MRIAGIGYEGGTVEDVVARLVEAGVDTVIDVRETPWSRKPGLSKTKLRAFLEAAGIEYRHMRAAGNPKDCGGLVYVSALFGGDGYLIPLPQGYEIWAVAA